MVSYIKEHINVEIITNTFIIIIELPTDNFIASKNKKKIT